MSGEIYAAMAKVMAEVGSVGKTRKNQQQGYQFRGIDDVMAHVQLVLASHGVVVTPEVIEREREMIPTKSGGTMASVRLLVRHTFHATDGSCVYATTLGEAMDAGDKASNKAMSAALKYALTESLMIPTYEADRDTEDASPQMAPSTPQTSGEMTAALRASITQIENRREATRPDTGALFPPYGKAAGKPVFGASKADLEFYLNGAKRSMADPEKAQWREANARLAAAIEAELGSEAF